VKPGGERGTDGTEWQEATMHGRMVSRRALLTTALGSFGVLRLTRAARTEAASAEIKLPDDVPMDRFDFETKGIEGWTTVDGQWAVEDMEGAPSGRKVLVQRATKNSFNVIVAPPGAFSDVDVTMKFKPISGQEDASGGIVFRFMDGKYYVVRANALEDNFNLYYYDRGRRQLSGTRVKAPALGQWHTVRLVALGDHMQAWLNGKLLLDHHDSRFKSGRVGLWTKADSITAFDDLAIRGVMGGG
jgi:3-keto-disaccharide hydrolase